MSLPVHRRVKDKDEELGKRSIGSGPRPSVSLTSAILRPWQWRKQRLLAVVAGLALLYFLTSVVPLSLQSTFEYANTSIPSDYASRGYQETREPTGPPPRLFYEVDDEHNRHYYDGPIKFYRLAASLRGISKIGGSRSAKMNVLFAGSSLRSIANLVPMACEMANSDRNNVHLAILGRDSLAIGEMLSRNGVDSATCPIYLHDARCDYSEYSNDQRAEMAVAGAMKHINDYMNPRAIFTDDEALEDVFFTRAMRRKAKTYGHPLIEIPHDKYDDLLWMMKLDSEALANSYRPNVDILLDVPRGSSGGMLRLLNSLIEADYTGLRPPKLTIDVPSDIDISARGFLTDFRWPPGRLAMSTTPNSLTLRYRLSPSQKTPEEAALRFLESFHPTRLEDNHVLILSPHIELSPHYFQYLSYLILEYKYASLSHLKSLDLFGISLDVPLNFLNGSVGFVPPKAADMDLENHPEYLFVDSSSSVPFLYQAPSSSATLIFGDRWTTFVDFYRNRVAARQDAKVEKKKKLVSESEPAWTEYLLELLRARNWFTLHPASPFVVAHNDLARIPEEHVRPRTNFNPSQDATDSTELVDQPFLTPPDPFTIPNHPEQPSLTSNEAPQPLHSLLPFSASLPELRNLPLLDYHGQLTTRIDASLTRDRYVPEFRRRLGGCSGEAEKSEAERKRVFRHLRTDDLFCLPGVEREYEEATFAVYEDDEDEEEDDDDDVVASIVPPKTISAAGAKKETKATEASEGTLSPDAAAAG